MLKECIKQSPMLLDIDRVPIRKEQRFWEVVHGALGDALRERFADSSQLQYDVTRWTRGRRAQLGCGQPEPPPSQRHELDEHLDRWIHIWCNRFCLTNMDNIRVGVWYAIEDKIKKMVCELVRADLGERLRRYEDEQCLSNRTNGSQGAVSHISSLGTGWKEVDSQLLLKGEALVRLVESFKLPVERAILDDMETRIRRKSRALRSRHHSVFSPEPASETDLEPDSGQEQVQEPVHPENAAPNAPPSYEVSTNGPEELLQTVELGMPSPSKSPSPPMPDNTTSCRVYRPGEGWRTHIRRTRHHGPWEFSETETDVMSLTQSPRHKRVTPHDDVRDPDGLLARKKQKLESIRRPECVIQDEGMSSFAKPTEATRFLGSDTQQAGVQETGRSAGHPIVISHESDVDDPGPESTGKPTKRHKKGKHRKTEKEANTRSNKRKHEKGGREKIHRQPEGTMGEDSSTTVPRGTKCSRAKATDRDDKDSLSSTRAKRKKRRLPTTEDDTVVNTSASGEEPGESARHSPATSRETSEYFPSIEEIQARVSNSSTLREASLELGEMRVRNIKPGKRGKEKPLQKDVPTDETISSGTNFESVGAADIGVQDVTISMLHEEVRQLKVQLKAVLAGAPARN